MKLLLLRQMILTRDNYDRDNITPIFIFININILNIKLFELIN